MQSQILFNQYNLTLKIKLKHIVDKIFRNELLIHKLYILKIQSIIKLIISNEKNTREQKVYTGNCHFIQIK
jgi:hypothetical protein